MSKEILHAWVDVFNDAVAVNYASGNWPRAFASRWYPVTDAERRLTSPLLVASSDCSRCLKTFIVFRKFFSKKRAQATTNQRMPMVTHLNTKDMLTAIDTAETFNETLAQFQARESWWEREVMENFNVPAFHFVKHVLHRSRGPADNPFRFSQCSIDQVCCC